MMTISNDAPVDAEHPSKVLVLTAGATALDHISVKLHDGVLIVYIAMRRDASFESLMQTHERAVAARDETAVSPAARLAEAIDVAIRGSNAVALEKIRTEAGGSGTENLVRSLFAVTSSDLGPWTVTISDHNGPAIVATYAATEPTA
jgi:hypothetical protein